MNKQILFLCWMVLCTLLAEAQETWPIPTSKRGDKASRVLHESTSLFSGLAAENIGPTIFNGRVADLDVN
ncbi:MAG: hypothetical protein WBO36_09715, partial [Saprospiraceae bacterium]